jgi:membrane protein implicated in regulation of membrane protease activity
MSDQPVSIGLLGTATSALSLLISFLPHITVTLQFATACVGLVVAIITAIYMSRKLKQQSDEKNN